MRSSPNQYMALTSLIVSAVVVSHLITGRYCSVAAQPVSCSIWVYPLTLWVTAVVTRAYGWRCAMLLVTSGFCIELLVHGLVWLAYALPTAASSPVCPEVFGQLLSTGWCVWLACLAGQCAVVGLFAELRTPLPALPRPVMAAAGLASVFVAVLLLTNVITVKYFRLGRWVLTAGALTYPFTFTVLDIISELYGPRRARWVVWAGFVASLFMTAVVYVVGRMPVHPQSPMSQEAFQCLFGFTPGIVIGSMVAYLAAQLLDVALFAWMHRLTRGKHLWLRNGASTLISQWLDTLLFGLIAWVLWPQLGLASGIAPLPWAAWTQVVLNEYGFKVIFTVLNTPLVYAGVHAIRRWPRQATTL